MSILPVKDDSHRFTSADVKLLSCLPVFAVFLPSDFLILPGFIDFTSDEVVSVITTPQLTLTVLYA